VKLRERAGNGGLPLVFDQEVDMCGVV